MDNIFIGYVDFGNVYPARNHHDLLNDSMNSDVSKSHTEYSLLPQHLLCKHRDNLLNDSTGSEVLNISDHTIYSLMPSKLSNNLSCSDSTDSDISEEEVHNFHIDLSITSDNSSTSTEYNFANTIVM